MTKTHYKQPMICAFFIFGLVALAHEIKAQDVVNTSSAHAIGSEGTAVYSIGQIVYTTNTGSNGTVAQGVQQPYEISEVTFVAESEKISFSVYPNPAADYLYLSRDCDEFRIADLSFRLCDSNGRTLRFEKIRGGRTTIVMTGLVPSTYFLKIDQGNKTLKTYKIIKK
ncbi:T9SS type A sorting domain-containing protein [Bacteroides heparinolyticus]|uniref:T9SS type A sorting domain-containing protein n=1 Tax=Prevotella heparinolytica TaxID=28113 RepID=UPI0035A080DA